MVCYHTRKELVRVISRDGRTQIMERCQDCGQNARGAGRWVPRAEVSCDPNTLPIAKDLRTPETKGEQGYLF